MKSKKLRNVDLIVEGILKVIQDGSGRIDVEKEKGFVVINYMPGSWDTHSQWKKIKVSVYL